MWDMRDGTVVRDLLTGVTGVWQVVFDGRWCVAASNRMDVTHLDVWDFGGDDNPNDWVGETNSVSDDEEDYEEEEEEDQSRVEEIEDGLLFGNGIVGNASDMEGIEENEEDAESSYPRSWAAGPVAGPSRLVDRALNDAGLFLNASRSSGSGLSQFPPANDETPSKQGSSKPAGGRGR